MLDPGIREREFGRGEGDVGAEGAVGAGGCRWAWGEEVAEFGWEAEDVYGGF